MIAGIVIFVLAYIAIASEKIDKTIAAMLGAGLMVVFKVAGFNDMLGKVDLNVLGLLVGMMIIVNIMATTGVFEYLAVQIARQTKGNGVLVTVEFLLATAIVSAFMDNVTTVILMAPVTILITQLLGLPTVPILILEAIFSNIGGTATLIGDPPNILIGASCGLSFNDFLINLTPIIVVITLAILGIVVVFMGKRLRSNPEAVAQVQLTEPRLAAERFADRIRFCAARLFHQPPDPSGAGADRNLRRFHHGAGLPGGAGSYARKGGVEHHPVFLRPLHDGRRARNQRRLHDARAWDG